MDFELEAQNLSTSSNIRDRRKMARVFQRLVPSKGPRFIFRPVSRTSRHSSTQNPKVKLGFFDKLWDMGDLAPYLDAHSKTLTANPACYELVCKYFIFIL